MGLRGASVGVDSAGGIPGVRTTSRRGWGRQVYRPFIPALGNRFCDVFGLSPCKHRELSVLMRKNANLSNSLLILHLKEFEKCYIQNRLISSKTN